MQLPYFLSGASGNFYAFWIYSISFTLFFIFLTPTTLRYQEIIFCRFSCGLSILFFPKTFLLAVTKEKKLDGNYTRMLPAILNKSWKHHPKKLLLYCHLPLILQTIQVRRTRLFGHCWGSRDKLISDVLMRTFTHGRISVGQPTKTYLNKLCTDIRWSLEDLPRAMGDRDGEIDR